MSQPISLKETERQVFRSTFEDGLWEVFVGSFLSMFGLAPLLSTRLGDLWSSAIFGPLWLVVYAVIWLLRRYVITPRAGTVRFAPSRQKRLMRFTLAMLVVNVVALIAGTLAALTPAAGGSLPMAALGAIFLATMSLAAYLLDYPLLYVYGLLAGSAPLVGEWLWRNYGVAHHGLPVTFGIASGVMIVVGLAKFVTLLYRYPLPAEGGEGA